MMRGKPFLWTWGAQNPLQHFIGKFCPCHHYSQMTPQTVITLLCETVAEDTEAWQVASPSHAVSIGRLVFDLCLRVQNWELFATLSGRPDIGPKHLFVVTHLYAWDWCVWSCTLSAHNSSSTCLILDFREIFLLSLLPEVASFSSLPGSFLGFPQCPTHLLRRPMSAQSLQSGTADLLMKRLLYLGILLWMITFWHDSHRHTVTVFMLSCVG